MRKQSDLSFFCPRCKATCVFPGHSQNKSGGFSAPPLTSSIPITEPFFEMSDESISVEIYSNESTPQTSPQSSQEVEEASEHNLQTTAAQDEALWPDEHSSDEEEFDPANPTDLTTQNAKELAENDPSVDSCEEEDDSIVVSDNEEELECANHEVCIAIAARVDTFLLESMSAVTGKKERRAALVEAICDHYKTRAE